ncbi:perilipin-2-like [Heterodontus francisci]|uniref:perilipin-2-like n=1 Tax=Heterodontus francisci TaxID=7792 RepID=UPI00355B7B74
MAERSSSNRDIQPSVVWRVGRLPLVNSASQVLLTTYVDIRRTNWLTTSICSVVEKGARMATGVAARGAKPFLEIFESQIASANAFASNRLDKLEEKYPILQLSIDEVAFHLRESFTLALDDVQERVSEEAEKLKVRTSAMMEETQAVISSQATAFLTSRVGQVMVATGDGALLRLEGMVDHYLPDIADDCAPAAFAVGGFDREVPVPPSLYSRVRCLTVKVRSRLYQRTLLYSQSVQEEALTDMLLLMEVVDWLTASQAYTVADRIYQLLLWLYVSLICRLQDLQTLLLNQLSAAGRGASAAWSLSLSFTGRAFSLALHLLSQLTELASLLVLFLFNVFNALLFDVEDMADSAESGDESEDSHFEFTSQHDSRRDNPRGGNRLSCVSKDDLRKLLEHASQRRQSLGWEVGPSHLEARSLYQWREDSVRRRRSSETWAVPPQDEQHFPCDVRLPVSRRRSSVGQSPCRSPSSQSQGYRPSFLWK